MEKNLIARTLTFYIVLIILILINIAYIPNPIINLFNIIFVGVVAYLYMTLINDVNKLI